MHPEIREGMPVYDTRRRKVGRVEDLRDGHFFLTHSGIVKERVVVSDGDVAGVNSDGVDLRYDVDELLARMMRPPEALNHAEVLPHERVDGLERGDEDTRALDADDVREQRSRESGPHGGLGPNPTTS